MGPNSENESNAVDFPKRTFEPRREVFADFKSTSPNDGHAIHELNYSGIDSLVQTWWQRCHAEELMADGVFPVLYEDGAIYLFRKTSAGRYEVVALTKASNWSIKGLPMQVQSPSPEFAGNCIVASREDAVHCREFAEFVFSTGVENHAAA